MFYKVVAAIALGLAGCLNGVLASDRRPDIGASHPASARPLIVGDVSGRTVTLLPDDLAKLRRTTVRERIPHSTTTVAYEGVVLGEVLRQAGIDLEDKTKRDGSLTPALRSAYVLIEAADGYQVVFSISEVAPDLGDRAILLASARDGKPLDPKAAPYQVIVPASKSVDRWIRQVTRILVRPASSSAFATGPATASASPAEVKTPKPGLYLLGLGPGSPDLITARAARILRTADVVLCFSWMKDELAPLARPGTVEVASPLLMGGQYCGRKPEEVPADLREQVAQTNDEAAKLKRKIQKAISDGKTVAIADNGDPTMFSPWNWITVSFADLRPWWCPESARSMRPTRSSGKGSPAKTRSPYRRATTSARRARTGPVRHGRILHPTHEGRSARSATPHRYPADTPVAIVCDATYPTERVVRSDLGRVLEAIGQQKLPQLYLFYVGDALRLGGENWTRPITAQ